MRCGKKQLNLKPGKTVPLVFNKVALEVVLDRAASGGLRELIRSGRFRGLVQTNDPGMLISTKIS